MRKPGFIVVAVLLAASFVPTVAHAQEDPAPVIFGIYYRCNQAQEARADEIRAQVLAPIVQMQVEAGRLTGALWLAHVQGGEWRRIEVALGNDINAMMDARAAIVEEIGANHATEMAELQTACPTHDDYIWVGIANSPQDPDTVGNASLSAYHSCDMSREARADEIFTEIVAPLYQKHMDMGHLSSWGYYSHRIGGEFRRLETMSGADHKTLLAMQSAIYEEAGQNNAAAMEEFRSICSWHSDYMWENRSGQ